ncbi:MAG: hypothetical protein WDA12_02065 [Bacilli bacterium]
MKKIFTLIILICVFTVTGCSLVRSKTLKYQEVIEDYGRDYYEKYQKGISTLNSFEVTIELLKNANAQGSNYDLTKLDKCSDSSKISFTINEDTKEIQTVNFEMNCQTK